MGMLVCRSFRTRDTTAVALSRRRSGAKPLHSVAERRRRHTQPQPSEAGCSFIMR